MEQGKTILHYKILEKLGEGGMGVVYKARDTKLDREVALKFLPESLTPTEEDRQRFIREAKSAAALSHPNICTIHNIDEYEGTPFIVMEYIEGETLRAKMDRGDLGQEQSLNYARQIAEALGKAHEADIIHRDIKPENIMFDADGRIKVMDFGLAKLKQGRDITKTGDTVGTLAYSSPEQIRGEEVDHRSDLFSLGIVFYEMLTGQKPFQGEHQAAMTYSIVNEEPVPLETYLPDAPEELKQIIGQLLAKDPEDRLNSAREVTGLLKRIELSTELSSQQSISAETKSESMGQDSGSSSTLSITVPNFGLGNKPVSKAGLLAGTAIVLALVLAGWWFMGVNTGRDNISVDEDRVAVFPFTVRGSDELTYLGKGMVELMSRSIDGAGPIKTVDPKALLTQVEREGLSGEVGPSEGRKVAANFDAGRFILGSILRVGNDINLSATWYGPDGKQIGSADVLAENREQIQQSIDELARHAITDLAGEEAGHRQRLAAQMTSSVEALKAYLEGQEARRSFEMDRAQASFERAVEEDPGFALAYYGLSWAAGWEGNVDVALSSAAKAVELSEGLPERDRQLFKAWHHFYEGSPKEAERLYRRIIDTNPDDLDAWQGLGETLFHFNQTRGIPVTEAREPLERAVELDPSNSEPIQHLLGIAAIERDSNAVDSLIIKLENLNTDESGIWRRVHTLIFGEGSTPAIKEMSYNGVITGSILLYYFGRFEKVEKLIETFLASDHAAGDEIDARAVFAHIYAGQGKFKAGRKELETIGSLDTAVHLIPRAKMAVLPFLPENEKVKKERTYLLDRLLTWDPSNDSERFKPSWAQPSDEISLRLYLLGLLRATEGDITASLEIADDLKSRESPQVFSSLTSDLSRGLLAEAAHREADREEALKYLEAIEIKGALGLPHLYTGARERFLRAELLAETGRPEEALRWYRTFNGVSFGNFPYMGPAHLGRAEVLEKLGRPEEAARAYERFIKLWENADPMLQPMVEDARERLAQLPLE